MSEQPALRVSGLTVAYDGDGGENVVVRGADLAIGAGTVVGLAGESGSGKSTLALAAIGYSAPAARVLAGSAVLGGRDLYGLSRTERRQIWGGQIGFVAQSASEAMNPAMRIGRQLGQTIRIHQRLRGRALLARQIEILARVGIPDPQAALRRYPHEFSGGQLQRIAIAAAVACEPRVLILDEPTTGLDVQTQRQISSLIRELVTTSGMGALFVTHDLALLSEISDEAYLMYAGQIVESGSTLEVLGRPRHPYTRALLDAAPSIAEPRMLIGIPGRPPTTFTALGCGFADRCGFVLDACRARPIELETLAGGHAVRCLRQAELRLEPTLSPLSIAATTGASEPSTLVLHGLTCRYRSAPRDAVHDVSLTLHRGEAIGLVGESGSGKSTLLRLISGLIRPTQGSVRLNDQPLAALVGDRERDSKREIQLIFQNPDSSLNPSHTIAQIIRRPLRLFRPELSRAELEQETRELLAKVSLPEEYAHRFPDELSGGQKQRVAIARAFAARPTILLCDEVTSALDVSVQATIVTLISELASSEGIAVVFVSHDLAVVRAIASRIAVMKDGVICEEGPADRIFDDPQADYTKALLAASPAIPASAGPPERATRA